MIGIVDYGMGNLHSVKNILDYLEIENQFVQYSNDFNKCTHLIIPGVGSFSRAMENLKTKSFVKLIKEFAGSGKPVLCICLGMQLLADFGTEPVTTEGIGLIPGTVKLLPIGKLRIPHMGWNGIKIINTHPILENVKLSDDFYFVHSYAFDALNSNNIVSTTNYESDFVSIITNNSGNVIGIQFHPEKSQKQGIKIIENFSTL
jgi:glutamine amidotransferase